MPFCYAIRHLSGCETASMVNQSAYFLAIDNLFEVAHNIHVEDIDGQVVVVAHTDGAEVHHLQIACQHLVVGDVCELRCRRVFLGVSGIDAAVVKYGAPVPAEKIHTNPCSSASMARHLL